MAVTDCAYPVLGRFKAAAIFLADDCGAPIGGTDAGWVDQCPGAFAYSANVTEGEDFERQCADGSTLVSVPGVDTLTGYQIDLDLHTADPGLWAAVAGATPVIQGSGQTAETVGWDVCADSAGSASLFLWREIVGADACSGPTADPQYLVTIFPWVDGIRLVEQGTFGGADSFLRLTGTARTGHAFGKGPLPIWPGAQAADPPTCLTQPLEASCAVRNVITTVPWPDDCGFVDVTICT